MPEKSAFRENAKYFEILAIKMIFGQNFGNLKFHVRDHQLIGGIGKIRIQDWIGHEKVVEGHEDHFTHIDYAKASNREEK